MLVSFARGAAILSRDDYLETARRNGHFSLEHMVRDGKLLRTWKDDEGKLNGYLEDYANLVEGLITLFEATGESQWLNEAVRLNEILLNQFWDEASSSFYLTGRDHEQLIARVRDFYDNAMPAGSSVAVFNLLRLALLIDQPELRRKAEANLSCMKTALERHPSGFGYLLEAADFCIGPVREIAIIGSRAAPATRQLLEGVYKRYIPNKIVALGSPDHKERRAALPLLEGKTLVENKPAAYVCQNYACQAPVISSDELEQMLRRQ
jgi:uncharacterized protein YyaL (SSP411 family)